MGLKRIQLIYLLLIPLLAKIIHYRETHNPAKEFIIRENHPVHHSLYLLALALLMIITRNWFSTVEFNIILFVLIPVSIGIVMQVLKHLYSLQVRISVSFLIVLSFVLMGQTMPTEEKKIYHSLKIGYAKGNFDTTHDIGTGEGCDRRSQMQQFHQNYKMMGIGYSITETYDKKMVEYGINGYYGQHTELGKTSHILTENIIGGINPYVKFDYKWMGIGGGFHIGDLRYSPIDWVENKASEFPTTGTSESPFIPQLYVRVGPRQYAFFSFKYADQFPSPFPGLYTNLELGSGFGSKSGFNLRMGSNGHGLTYLTGYLPINNVLVIEPFYGRISSGDLDQSIQQQFSFGLHYRFGHKTKTVVAKPATDNNN